VSGRPRSGRGPGRRPGHVVRERLLTHNRAMPYSLMAPALALLLLAGMLLCLEAGRRVGQRRLRANPDVDPSVSAALDGAVFALFGLLIAFTFSGAMTRFDGRRQLVVREANAIGTAWLRIDLLPEATQPEVRALFRRYVEARLAGYRLVPDMAASAAAFDRATALQGQIWTRAMEGARASASPAVATLVAPALNDMIDLTTTRRAATWEHPPLPIFLLLYGLGFASSLVAGVSTARSTQRSWLHASVYAGVIAAAVFVIIDMEFPRLGFIRVDGFDVLLEEVLVGMK